MLNNNEAEKKYSARCLGDQTNRFLAAPLQSISVARCSKEHKFFIFFSQHLKKTHQTNIKNYNYRHQNPVFDISKANHEGGPLHKGIWTET